ncbi:hypothetical protein PoB_003609500 [Plakobranchus ocellatus]|uniref:Uncharacterized protein n=1 Tax=Plakobranchus ocellatus TaxID=259542 RepID=A0AAV4AQI3_9GAST|nr:hypothetical protein PoB_003609500 [Plakobranchus ocellatus]
MKNTKDISKQGDLEKKYGSENRGNRVVGRLGNAVCIGVIKIDFAVDPTWVVVTNSIAKPCRTRANLPEVCVEPSITSALA